MTDPITTSDRQVYRWGVPRCYVADALRSDDFELVEYLYCRKLRRACGPEIDQAICGYDYGLNLREGRMAYDEDTKTYTLVSPAKDAVPVAVPMQDLVGKFIRIVVPDTVYEDAIAADPESEEPDKSIVWYGVIEYDDRQTDGTHHPSELTYDPQGHQEFMAFGVLRLADKDAIRSSKINVDDTIANLIESKCGLNFNTDSNGQFAARGNRSSSKPGDSPSYVFSFQPRGNPEWNAYTAVQYLLEYHSPKKPDGAPANIWRFASDVLPGYLDWWKIGVSTDGHTLKQLLDHLIPRHRGVGYWVEFVPTETVVDGELEIEYQDTIVVHVFTFNKTDVALSGGTLKANPNQKSLDFEFAYDIDMVNIGNTTTQRYHKIVARGAKRTTTFTTRITKRPLDKWNLAHILGAGWSASAETEYMAGASAAADYASLTLEQKQNRNAIYRASSDRLREVFRRFIINPFPFKAEQSFDVDNGWNCAIGHPHSETSTTQYWLCGDITSDPFSAVASEDFDGTDYTQGLRILRGLPLYERTDYSGSNLASFSYDTTDGSHPSFIPLMVYARTHTGVAEKYDDEDEDPHRYELLDRLTQKAFGGATNRDWQARVFVTDTEPGIELHADCPHFLGGSTAGDGGSWAATAQEQLSSYHDGIMYTDVWVTLCVELTAHLEWSKTLSEPPTDAPKNVLLLSYPDARHDYVIPNTVVEIKDGIPIITTSGGAPLNGLDRIKVMAEAAAEWYSTVRQTLNLGWKQVRGLFQLGDLITDVGGRYQITDINTPITAIEYDFGSEHGIGQNSVGGTKIETAFTNMDFQA